MSKLNCNVVRDILPLYADEVVCDDTKQLVEEHLTECETCSKELYEMRSKVVIPVKESDELEQIKRFKFRWSRRQILKGAVLMLLVAVLFIGGFFYLYGYGLPVKGEDLILADGLQCVTEWGEDGTYGADCPSEKQTWVIDICTRKGDVRTTSEMVYAPDENGELIVSGVRIYARWSPIFFPWESGSNGLRAGFGPSDTEGKDFIVTIVCADQEFTYSMREEGVFDPPTEMHSAQFCPWAD